MADLDNEEETNDVEEDDDIPVDEEVQLSESIRRDVAEISVDEEAHQILQAQVDPVEWKTELERVGPKLRTKQDVGPTEWRAHVDQTVTSKNHIEKVLGETEGDLTSMQK